MAAADAAPATSAPSLWNADPVSVDEAAPEAAPAAPPQGALAPKRKAAAEKPNKAEAPKPKADGNPSLWDAAPAEVPQDEAPAAPPPQTDISHIAAQGVGSAIDKLGVAGSTLAGAFPVLFDKIRSAFGPETTAAGDAWFKHVVDPNIARDAEQQLPAGASFHDRAIWGVANMGATIASMFIGGAALGPAEATTTTGARLLGGAAAMQAPAASHAVDVGRTVHEATGDKRAAAIAATAAYVINVGMGLVPGGAGASRLTRAATGAAVGGATGEAARLTENQFLPEGQKAPFDPLSTVLNTVTGAGGAMVSHGEAPRVQEAPQTVMDHAQSVAAKAVADAGGDGLDQVVAATQVNAEVGAHHDAAAVEATRQEAARAQAFQEAEATAGETPAQQALAKEGAFQQAEGEQAGQKDADFSKAQGQVEAEGAKTAEIGAEKGGATEPAPTVADSLPPEQVSALQALRDRLAAQKPAEKPEPTVVDRMRQQAKGTEDDFQELPPQTPAKQAPIAPKTVAERIAAQRAAKAEPVSAISAKESATEAELPEKNPPAPTTKSLAERRQQALDAAMAAKTKGTARFKQGGEPLRQNYDPAERELEEQVRRDADIAHANPTGKRPPLRQGRDPAEPLFEQKAAQDADIAAKRPASPRFATPEENIREDMFRATRMDKAEVTKHLEPMVSKLPTELRSKINYHDSTAAAAADPKSPIAPANRAALAAHPNARGMYDPDTNTIHIFGRGHETGDQDRVMRTLIHESAHLGVRTFLGNDYARTMNDIAVNGDAKIKSWMRDFAQRQGFDLRKESDRAAVADEYGATLAEDPTQHPTAWRKIVDSVRAGLRKLGVVKEWNENDIQHLLRSSDNHLAIRDAVEGRAYKGARFSEPEDKSYDKLPKNNPLAQAAKFGKTMEEQAKYNPGFIRGLTDKALDKWSDTLEPRLGAIGLRNLPDFLNVRTRPLMPSVKAFVRAHDVMDGRRGRLAEEAGKVALDWSGWATKNKRMAGNLGELMHASTLAGVDPSRPFKARYTDEQKAGNASMAAHEAERESFHKRAQDYYRNNLDDKGRELFNTVRDHYQDRRQDILNGLEQRIQESGAADKDKQQLMAELRKKFEQGRVEAPYFPLQRFGDHWAVAKDADGNHVAFSRFESLSQRKAWLQAAKEKGFEVDAGKNMDEKSMMERIDPDFVKKVTELAKAHDPSLADEIWQTYLKAMPEMSMRKHFIHRQGRLGFTMDALRNFSYNAMHNSHQIARLEHGNKLDTLVQNMKDEARNVEASPDTTDTDKQYAPALAKEMARRLDWIKNPRASALASSLTKFGFGWYLGFAPATAFRISTQNMMLAQPMLGKFHGQLNATKELSRATAQWAIAKGNLADKLRGDERRAFDEAGDQGVFSNTWAQTLASGGEGAPMTGAHMAFNRAAAYLFNAMEHKNRMTTFLAAYRLARAEGQGGGMSHTEAQQHATDVTWDSHFDYTNANRPRWLQNDFMKVAALFKQYSWGVTYRLAREFRDATRQDGGISPEDKVQAQKAFAGLLGRSFLFAGATGLPLAWAATSIMNMVFHDKDRPFDAEAEMHKQLTDHVGQFAADSIMTGPMGAVTGAALHGGASYSDLWYRPPSREESMTGYVSDALGQFLGAVPSIATNAATGADMAMNGNIERGLEHFLPPQAAAMAKALRYSQQGVTNLQGETVVPREELTNRDLFLQSIGFTPQKVADAYARNTAIQNASSVIQKRKQFLENQYDRAVLEQKDTQDLMREISRFNEKNPNFAVKGKSLEHGPGALAKKRAEAVSGVNLPPGLRDLEDQY